MAVAEFVEPDFLAAANSVKKERTFVLASKFVALACLLVRLD